MENNNNQGGNTSLAALIADDGYAMTFQSMGQYRTALLKAIDAASIPPLTAPAPLTDDVLMPKRLTAENGAKGALSGEFKESVTVTCHECGGSGDDAESDNDAECPECKGDGTLDQAVPVTWDTIKDIYARAVELLAKAAPAAPVQTAKHSGRYWAIHEGDLLGLLSADIGAAYVDPVAAAKRCRVTIHALPDSLAAPVQAEQAQANEQEIFGVLHDCLGGPVSRTALRKTAQIIAAKFALPAQAEQAAAVRAAYEKAAKVAEDTDVVQFSHALVLQDDGSQTRSNIADAIRALAKEAAIEAPSQAEVNGNQASGAPSTAEASKGGE